MKKRIIAGALSIFGLITIIGLISSSHPTQVSSEQEVKGIEMQQNIITSIPTLAPTLTPTLVPTNTSTSSPIPRHIPKSTFTPTPTPNTPSLSSDSTSSLSNNNYYTNSDDSQVHSPAYSNSVPAGATAKCNDGTYSFSQHRQGTCSHHGGVAQWF